MILWTIAMENTQLMRHLCFNFCNYNISSIIVCHLRWFWTHSSQLPMKIVTVCRPKHPWLFTFIPKILGEEHLNFMVDNGFFPEELKTTLHGSLVRKLGVDATWPLDQMRRGLYAVPLEVVRVFEDEIISHRQPGSFIESVHPHFGLK